MSRTFVNGTQVDELPDPGRRALSFGLGLFPLLALLLACSAGAAEAGTSEQLPASASGVFRHPGLLVTDADIVRIREHIKSGQQPWTDWWNKLCADRATSLDDKPHPLAGVYGFGAYSSPTFSRSGCVS